MKVKELIEKLQKCDPEADIVHHGYEDGYDIVGDLLPRETTVYPRFNDNNYWWNGDYEEVTDWDEHSESYYDKSKPLKVVIV